MDLAQFDTRQKAEAGVDIELEINGERVIADDGKPVTFKIKGAHDEDVRAHIIKSRKTEAATPKEIDNSDMKLARLAVIGWSNNFTTNGETLPFSKQNIDLVFANPVVRAAVVAEIFETSHFMNGS